jgi:hypothetical protein
MATRPTEKPVRDLRPGDHAAFTFATIGEQAAVIGPFLDVHHKVIYLGDARPRHLPGLCHRPDADHAAATGQLRLIPPKAACLTAKRFDPDRMCTVVGEEIAVALEQGYRAIRITADMTWVLDDRDGLTRMLACETNLHHVITPGTALMAICQLDRTRCPPDQHRALTSTLCVPKIRPPYATCAYSWISPPSRSRRMTLMSASTGSSNGRSGLARFKARWGRRALK